MCMKLRLLLIKAWNELIATMEKSRVSIWTMEYVLENNVVNCPLMKNYRFQNEPGR